MIDDTSSRHGAWVESACDPAVVCLGGELDVASRGRVEGELMARLRPSADLTIDCRDLSFCDSSGLATLIAVHEKASTQAATVRLSNVRTNVVRLLKATALMTLFDVREAPTPG